MIKTGGPAFPSHGSMGEVAHEGMTLRDWFAAKAMQSLILNGRTLSPDVPLTARAYEIADLMIDRRKENESE